MKKRDVPVHKGTPAEVNEIVCKLCKKRFDTEKGLKIHIGRIHPEAKGNDGATANVSEIVCKLRDNTFDAENGQTMLITRSHKDNGGMEGATGKVNGIVCKLCNKTFDTGKGLKIHIGRIHPDGNVNDGATAKVSEIVCKVSDKTFDAETVHMTRSHKDTCGMEGATGKVNGIVCKLCRKTFDTEKGLKIHIGRIHPDGNVNDGATAKVSEIVCKIRDKTFNAEKEHMTRSHKDTSGMEVLGATAEVNGIVCTVCDKVFDTENYFKIHMGRSHTDTSRTEGTTAEVTGMVRTLSDKKFNAENDLKINMGRSPRVTSGNNDKANDIVCTVCHRKFDTEIGLKIHMGRSHRGTSRNKYSKIGGANYDLLGNSLELSVKKDKKPVNEAASAELKRDQEDFKLSLKDIGEASEVINSFIDSFVNKLNEISNLGWTDFKSGSYYDKTKNDFPDEFDIMLYPDVQVSVDFEHKSTPGFYKVKLVSVRLEEFENITDKDGYIFPKKFKKYAFRMFSEVLDEIREGRRTKRVKKSNNSPAYTINYKAILGKPIDIDLVPSFRIDGWPLGIARRVNPKWITSDKVANDSMMSYDVVCKTYPGDIPNKCLLWRLSFSLTERMLVTHANGADSTRFRKNAYRFLKKCIQDIKEENPEKITKFCSYYLKQFMFTQYDTWPTTEKPEVLIQRNIIHQLIHALSLSPPTICNYFIENDNVIQFVPPSEIDMVIKGLKEKVKRLQ